MSSTWVAIVFDLIAKYRELSAMGDGAATAFIGAWDNATASGDIKKLLQLEASIVDDATKNTQLINRIAATHLERLREDRHLCAHPAFSAEAELFEPTSELVRLHLANAVDLVLSREPLQGKAIFDLYDVDVQSAGFPTDHARVLDYVEQRYLERVRPQNVRNFGVVLSKSLLRGVPPQWEAQQRKVVSTLVAIRERAPSAWADVANSIVVMIDSLEPQYRARAIAFIGAFPDFWNVISAPVRTGLKETVDNANPGTLDDFRILAGVTVPHLRPSIVQLISGLGREKLASAIALNLQSELWQRAVELYENSGGWRTSEANFRELIAPFSGQLDATRIDQLFDAIISNGQNWDAAETHVLLLGILRSTAPGDFPTNAARDRFHSKIKQVGRLEKYSAVIELLGSDGWTPAVVQAEAEAEE